MDAVRWTGSVIKCLICLIKWCFDTVFSCCLNRQSPKAVNPEVGEIKIGLRYDDGPKNVLQIQVISASGLKAVNWGPNSGTSDPYVKLKVFSAPNNARPGRFSVPEFGRSLSRSNEDIQSQDIPASSDIAPQRLSLPTPRLRKTKSLGYFTG